MLAQSLREKVVVALLRMPGTEGRADRSLLIPIPHDEFDRRDNRRNDFELIVNQLEGVGTRHVSELLEKCSNRLPGTELERELRALRAELERTIAPPKPRPVPAPQGAFYLRSGELWKTGELPLDQHAEGNSASPALAWENVPLNTRSLAVVMEDYEAADGEPRYYWGQVGIHPGVESLPRDAGVFDPTLARDVYGRPLATDASDLEAYPGVQSSDVPRLYRIGLYALAEEVPSEVTTARELASWADSPGRALAVAELPTLVCSPYTNRTFLFDGHAAAGHLLGARPRTVFLVLLSMALITLAFPAWLIRVHSLPPSLWAQAGTRPNDNTGFYYQANWMFLYAAIIPSFYAGAAAFGIRLRRSAQRLSNRFSGVIKSPPGRPFFVFLHDELKRRAFHVTAFSLAVALIATAIDTYSMFGVYCWGGDARAEAKDWCIAFTLGVVSKDRNLAFVIVAYLAQVLAIFLFAFITGKFFVFLRILSRTVRGCHQKDGYVFVPSWRDPDRRMGLGPLGVSYNTYAALALSITAFAVFHRLCRIGEDGPQFIDYLSGLRIITSFDLQQLVDLGRWSSINRGTWTLVFCLVLPVGVFAYFPLASVRGYLREFIAKRRDALNVRKRHVDDPAREQLEAELKEMQVAEVWPNGRRAALGSMTAWLVLFLTAIYPPAPILLSILLAFTMPAIAVARKALGRSPREV